MILEYKFKNFMSFRDNVEFSMQASSTKVKKRFPDNYITSQTGCDILKTAVIVGENAGGKSNFVRSLDYFKMFFVENERVHSYKNTVNINNINKKCPFCCNTLQTFEIEVLYNNYLYLYNLEIDYAGIVSEKLAFKTARAAKWNSVFTIKREGFETDCEVLENCDKEKCQYTIEKKYMGEIVEFGDEIENKFKSMAENSDSIGLNITKLALLGNEHAINFSEWVKIKLNLDNNTINYNIYRSIKKAEEDVRILKDKRYLEIFKLIDYSIVDIDVDEERPYEKTFVIRKKEDGSLFSREIRKDSNGVVEFFAWAVQIFKVVYENNIIFADEMDRVLNPILSDRIISYVNGKRHCGQFIFTTHNVLHLDLKKYMKEQIYFISKEMENLESELFSLADFPEIRYETTQIYELYMKGILGGTAFE